jgi:hypothetical protein
MSRRPASLGRAVLLAALGLLASCAVGVGGPGPGYYGGDVGYVGGYYDPCCWGGGGWGWGGHYHVGPPRGGPRPGFGGGPHPGPGGHGGGGRPAPSIPSHGRPR